ncbi:Smr domain containing protein [Parasponia andersonii]|uniref:Smr domain containing protein n=1 Tax=Parasponia andersonii TaxID=3476 RepID=A0A2P5AGC4_PARAD|nr:Smr domain containing protein [Parasponia andersonii]
MSFRNGKSSGWAAFNRDQRRKQGLQPQNDDDDDDPFPPLTPPPPPPSSSSAPAAILSSSNGGVIPKLKELYSWADHSLIEDVMAAVDDDFDRASTLLRAMVPSSTTSTQNNLKKKNKDHLEMQMPMPVTDHTAQAPLKGNSFECDSGGKQLSEDMKRLMNRLNSVPIEPEWEDEDDDDVYLRHRKEALRTMRSASQHSKAATNAFLKGNHFSAHQHSLKAQQQWLAAQTLNAKAAKVILSIRNSQNDVWNLDLHGLHANEAIQVLRQRLHQIETHLLSNRSLSPNSLKMESKIVRSPSLESFDSIEPRNLDKEHASLRQRPTSLHVITGVGNHSRGQASLPAAVRGFLSENGYHFDELKPGVISIRPKFRVLS